MNECVLVDYVKLCKLVSEKFQTVGVMADVAATEARIMVDADLLGVPSHGVRMLPNLLNAIASHRVNFKAPLTKLRDMGAITLLDCHNGLGRFSALRAMDLAIERAKQFGVGVCLAKNTTHWGRAHAYASHAASLGCIGICTTNAIPTMTIGGANKPVIGNNPLAIGVPSACNRPFVLDMAMSQAAVGKVNTWLREGREAPAHWGIDLQGNPTTDPKEILAGAVLPMGEHKGAGLAVMMELLTAALAGAAFTHDIFAGDHSGVDRGSSKIFIALNVGAFIEPEYFQIQQRYFLDYLQQSAAPFQYPSERGWDERDKNLAQGVPLHIDIVNELAAVGIVL